MKRLSALGLVVVGVVIGCGAAVTIPTSFAAPEAGSWACYRSRDLDEPRALDSKGNALSYAVSLNKVAAHVPAGAMVNLAPAGGSYQTLCVKH